MRYTHTHTLSLSRTDAALAWELQVTEDKKHPQQLDNVNWKEPGRKGKSRNRVASSPMLLTEGEQVVSPRLGRKHHKTSPPESEERRRGGGERAVSLDEIMDAQFAQQVEEKELVSSQWVWPVIT